MVALKGLLVAAFFVVGRVIAVPLPGSELSVTSSDTSGINDVAIDSRDSRSVFGVAIEARKDKPKSTTPTKTPAKKPSKKPTNEPAKKPGKPKSCPPKRPRGLERRYLEVGKDAQKVNEHQFVISKASTTVWNLSGCTAVFFWNYSKTPSAFHIFCGDDEQVDGKKAADIALNAGADSYFAIVAAKQSSYAKVLKGIEETFAKEKISVKQLGEPIEEGNGNIVQVKLKYKGENTVTYEKKDNERAKITATKGNTNLVLGYDDISECSVQAQ